MFFFFVFSFRTMILVCFKRFFLYFLLTLVVCKPMNSWNKKSNKKWMKKGAPNKWLVIKIMMLWFYCMYTETKNRENIVFPQVLREFSFHLNIIYGENIQIRYKSFFSGSIQRISDSFSRVNEKYSKNDD